MQFQRATVESNGLRHSNYRISKSAWLDRSKYDVVQTIGRRIEDMTGLTVSTAEPFQVANYGIGGHYEPHLDCFGRIRQYEHFGLSDRIATVLFYVSKFLLAYFRNFVYFIFCRRCLFREIRVFFVSVSMFR